MTETVVVLGASPNPHRYSNKAVRELVAKGHRVIPVRAGAGEVVGIPAVQDLSAVREDVDTVTDLRTAGSILQALVDALIELHPKRVILNPGTEDPGPLRTD